jgi:hypothetical protein
VECGRISQVKQRRETQIIQEAESLTLVRAIEDLIVRGVATFTAFRQKRGLGELSIRIFNYGCDTRGGFGSSDSGTLHTGRAGRHLRGINHDGR